MSNSTYAIGIGRIWVTPTNNYLGQVIPLEERTPILVGAIQDFSCGLASDVKSLKGSESKFALSNAQTGIELTGKFKYGNISGESIAGLFLGQTMNDGAFATVLDTVGHTINATYTVTIVAPNSGVYEKDLGVFYSATMSQLKRVDATPSLGEYTLNESTGVYVFSSLDENKKVLINFSYKASTLGKSLTVQNSAMGTTPFVRIDVLLSTADGEQILLSILKCVISKLDIASKMDDFTMIDAEFKACQDDLGRLFIFSTPR